eukprot:UN24599
MNEALSIGALKNVHTILDSECFISGLIQLRNNHSNHNRYDFQHILLEGLEKWTDMKSVHPVFTRLFEIMHQILMPQVNGSFNQAPNFWKRVFRYPIYAKLMLNKVDLPPEMRPPINGLVKAFVQTREIKKFSDEMDPEFEEMFEILKPYLKKVADDIKKEAESTTMTKIRGTKKENPVNPKR